MHQLSLKIIYRDRWKHHRPLQTAGKERGAKSTNRTRCSSWMAIHVATLGFHWLDKSGPDRRAHPVVSPPARHFISFKSNPPTVSHLLSLLWIGLPLPALLCPFYERGSSTYVDIFSMWWKAPV